MAAIDGRTNPRVSRGGRGRRTHPRPARHRPRTERHLLLDDAGPPVRARDGSRARRHDPHRPRGQPGGSPKISPPRASGSTGDHGRRRAAARPGRHLDHQQRLAGHGTDRRDGAPHVAARPRDESVAGVRGRARLARTSRRTTTPGCFATWRRSRRSRRARTGSTTRSGRLHPDTSRTSSCGSAASFGSQAGRGDEGRRRRVGADRRGERLRARSRANPVRSRLGRDGRCRRGAVDDVRLRRRARGEDISATLAHTPPGRGGQRDARHRTLTIWSRTPRYRRSRSRPPTAP